MVVLVMEGGGGGGGHCCSMKVTARWPPVVSPLSWKNPPHDKGKAENRGGGGGSRSPDHGEETCCTR